MLPPKKIHVGPFDFDCQHDPEHLAALGGAAAMNFAKLRIVYDKSQAPGYLRDSILHEVIHAAYQQTNLFENSEAANEREEALVAALTPRLLDVLRANPKLIAYLTEAP